MQDLSIAAFCKSYPFSSEIMDWARSLGITNMSELWARDDVPDFTRLEIFAAPGVFSETDQRRLACHAASKVQHLMDPASSHALDVTGAFLNGGVDLRDLIAAHDHAMLAGAKIPLSANCASKAATYASCPLYGEEYDFSPAGIAALAVRHAAFAAAYEETENSGSSGFQFETTFYPFLNGIIRDAPSIIPSFTQAFTASSDSFNQGESNVPLHAKSYEIADMNIPLMDEKALLAERLRLWGEHSLSDRKNEGYTILIQQAGRLLSSKSPFSKDSVSEIAGNASLLNYIASDPDSHPKALKILSLDPDPRIRHDVASNVSTPYSDFARLCSDPSPLPRCGAASNPNIPEPLQDILASDKVPWVRASLAANRHTASGPISMLSKDPYCDVVAHAAANKNLPKEDIVRLSTHTHTQVRKNLAQNHAVLPHILIEMVNSEFLTNDPNRSQKVFRALVMNPNTPEQSKILIDCNPRSRVDNPALPNLTFTHAPSKEPPLERKALSPDASVRKPSPEMTDGKD